MTDAAFVQASFTGQTAGTDLGAYVAQSGDIAAAFTKQTYPYNAASLIFNANGVQTNSSAAYATAVYLAKTQPTTSDQLDIQTDLLVDDITSSVLTFGVSLGDDGTGSNNVCVLTYIRNDSNKGSAVPSVIVQQNNGSTTQATLSNPAFTFTAGTTYTMIVQVRGSSGAYTINVLFYPQGGTPTAVISGLSVPGLTVLSRSVGLRAGVNAQQSATSGIQFKDFTASYYTGPLAANAVTTTTSGTGAVTVATTAASGGTKPYSYQFQRAPNASGSPGTWANIGTAGTALTYADSTLTQGSTYWYRVTVTDSASTPATSTSAAVSYLAPTPSFSLTTSPASAALAQAGSVTLVVTLAPSGGYSATDTLSVSSLPAGVSGSFSPLTIAGGAGTSALTLVATGGATTGTANITISATDGTITQSAPVALTVTAPSTGVTLDTVNNNVMALQNAIAARFSLARTF